VDMAFSNVAWLRACSGPADGLGGETEGSMSAGLWDCGGEGVCCVEGKLEMCTCCLN